MLRLIWVDYGGHFDNAPSGHCTTYEFILGLTVVDSQIQTLTSCTIIANCSRAVAHLIWIKAMRSIRSETEGNSMTDNRAISYKFINKFRRHIDSQMTIGEKCCSLQYLGGTCLYAYYVHVTRAPLRLRVDRCWASHSHTHTLTHPNMEAIYSMKNSYD